jgi:hypothetical protein
MRTLFTFLQKITFFYKTFTKLFTLMRRGSSKWQQQMAATNGSGKWQQQMAVANGSNKWQQLMVVADGSS